MRKLGFLHPYLYVLFRRMIQSGKVCFHNIMALFVGGVGHKISQNFRRISTAQHHLPSKCAGLPAASMNICLSSSQISEVRSFHVGKKLQSDKADAKRLKIYTKTGDKGTTSTFTGERRRKDDELIVALGTTDELSTSLGVAREFAAEFGHDFDQQLEYIQCILQDIGSSVATPLSSARPAHLAKTSFNPDHVKYLEEQIDAMEEQLPALKNFILPSGGKTSAFLQHARSVCRRAERSVIPLVLNGQVDGEPLRFLNRLSDYLFVLARFACMREGKEEKIYIRPKAFVASATGTSGEV